MSDTAGSEIRGLRACRDIGRAPDTTLDAIAEEVRRWQRETFPLATGTDYRLKLVEEVHELDRAHRGSTATSLAWRHVKEEIADVVICCIGFADRGRIDLASAIAEKLEINRKRNREDRR